MKTKLLGMCLIVLPATLVYGQSEFAGKWVGEMPGARGGNQTITLDLKVEGAELTGTLTQGQQQSTPISNGKIDGNKITFNNVLTFNGNETTIEWSGELKGGELTLTRAGGGFGRGGAPGAGGPRGDGAQRGGGPAGASITLKRAN